MKMVGLDMTKLESRKSKIISAAEAIRDEEVIAWNDGVTEGKQLG